MFNTADHGEPGISTAAAVKRPQSVKKTAIRAKSGDGIIASHHEAVPG